MKMENMLRSYSMNRWLPSIWVRSFAASLEQQDVEVVHVDWTPPAGGDQEMIDILDTLL